MNKNKIKQTKQNYLKQLLQNVNHINRSMDTLPKIYDLIVYSPNHHSYYVKHEICGYHSEML